METSGLVFVQIAANYFAVDGQAVLILQIVVPLAVGARLIIGIDGAIGDQFRLVYLLTLAGFSIEEEARVAALAVSEVVDFVTVVNGNLLAGAVFEDVEPEHVAHFAKIGDVAPEASDSAPLNRHLHQH